MGQESQNRAGLEFPNSPKSTSKRALRFARRGQGAGRWIQHQRNGLGEGAQERLGLLRGRGRDPAWNYDSVLKIYRQIEDWQGAPDPDHRGTGGLLFINSGIGTGPIVQAMFDGTRSVGIPTFDSINGRMMEGPGGCSLIEFRMRDWERLSIFRSYTFPYMDRPKLTVLTSALVTRLIFEGRPVTGVEFTYEDTVRRIGAGLEVVLSLGAINTPKELMHSGVGDQPEFNRFGIPLVEHLPGVGQNLQDHVALPGMIWECRG